MTDLLKLYRIAEDNEVVVDCFQLVKTEALSIMGSDGDCYIAIDPIKLDSEQDEKMKLAHELGHCCTGSFYNASSPLDIRQKHENTADKWAIKKLVPEEELNAAVAEGYTELWELAEYFDVTEDFIRKAVCWYIHGNLAVDLYF